MKRPLHDRAIVSWIIAAVSGVSAVCLFGAWSPAFSAPREKVVIPFDFVSQFDNGRYGRMVGDMIWTKINREGGFVLPESMLDVRDFCNANGYRVTPDMPLEEVRKIVVDGFGADIGIWGSVERAPGTDGEIYDLVIKCVDFSAYGEPKVIYELSGVRTNSVSEIPHLYVKEMLDKLYGREPGGPPPVNEVAEQNWEKNPNLLVGGDFERAVGGVPIGWEDRCGQNREPLGKLVQWLPEVGNPSNHVIRLTFDKGIGNSTGVMYYSKPFPIVEGATYRFQCRWRTNGPTAKVFIKCYAEMPSEYKSIYEASRAAAGRPISPGAPATRASSSGHSADLSQMHECYRSQQNLKGPKNTWNLHTEDFTPRHTRYTPTVGRVMLYGYLGGGVIEFDDCVLKMIIPASPGETKKDPRLSLESDVTIKEMEENERRAQELRQGGADDK
ncbi:MAG: hypothetical protein D6741_02225 [Planctomycetota bacterium]|nr:MAG: hypothetical protein D6741_02225 [Planctomycetota bacterium]